MDITIGATTYRQSLTAYKQGWGSAPWRSIKGLTKGDQMAVRDGLTVWFAFKPWHYRQSGIKVCTFNRYQRYDSREPTETELHDINTIRERWLAAVKERRVQTLKDRALQGYPAAMAIISDSEYRVFNVRTFRGREGVGLNADLWDNSRLVAYCDDPANGGGMRVTHLDAYGEWVRENHELDAFIAKLPAYTWRELGLPDDGHGMDEPRAWDTETFINALVEQGDEMRLRSEEFVKEKKET